VAEELEYEERNAIATLQRDLKNRDAMTGKIGKMIVAKLSA
jgi:hypothetical protein